MSKLPFRSRKHEREMIAQRTKAGLAAAKARGVRLGNADLALANKAAAIERAKALAPVFAELGGKSAREMARILNARVAGGERTLATPAARVWHAATVNRVRARLGA
jgi:DNA invertase Pin-like site-specific DNA recombinase